VGIMWVVFLTFCRIWLTRSQTNNDCRNHRRKEIPI
jgi:hypothetical protein